MHGLVCDLVYALLVLITAPVSFRLEIAAQGPRILPLLNLISFCALSLSIDTAHAVRRFVRRCTLLLLHLLLGQLEGRRRLVMSYLAVVADRAAQATLR